MSTVRPRANRSKNYDSVELKPLANAELDDDDDADNTDYGKTKTDKWLQYALHKLHALLWIVVASALAIWTQLFDVIMVGNPPNRPKAQLNRCASPPLHTLMRAAVPPWMSRHAYHNKFFIVRRCACMRAHAGSGSTSRWLASAAGS